MDLEGMSARGYAGTAVVQGLAHMRGCSGTSLIEFDSRFTALVDPDGGEARIAFYHSTGIG
jgi:hypothetical protein